MREVPLSLRAGATLFGLFVLSVVAGPAAAAMVRPSGAPVPAGHTYGHLYVGEPFRGEVLEFPLTSGIPAATPDRVITGLSVPDNLAIGPNGDLYIAEYLGPNNTKRGEVLVFSHGSTTPKRELDFFGVGSGHNQINAVAVDSSDRLYVAYVDTRTSANGVLIYAPRAHGNELPIGRVPGDYYPVALTLDEAGNVYFSDYFDDTVYEYATPVSGPTLVRKFCVPLTGALVSGLAVGERGEVYTAGSSTVQTRGFVYAFGPAARGCPTAFDRRIGLGNPGLGNPSGVAVRGDFLYVTDDGNPRLGFAPAIEVFRPNLGAQPPLAVVSGPGSMLSSPAGIVVGP
jgi:hypothetical protein